MTQHTIQHICLVVSTNYDDDCYDDDDDDHDEDDDDDEDDNEDDDEDVSTGNGVSPLVPAQNWEAPAFNKRMENCHHNHHHSHHYNHDQMENYTRRQCPTSLDPTR